MIVDSEFIKIAFLLFLKVYVSRNVYIRHS